MKGEDVNAVPPWPCGEAFVASRRDLVLQTQLAALRADLADVSHTWDGPTRRLEITCAEPKGAEGSRRPLLCARATDPLEEGEDDGDGFKEWHWDIELSIDPSEGLEGVKLPRGRKGLVASVGSLPLSPPRPSRRLTNLTCLADRRGPEELARTPARQSRVLRASHGRRPTLHAFAAPRAVPRLDPATAAGDDPDKAALRPRCRAVPLLRGTRLRGPQREEQSGQDGTRAQLRDGRTSSQRVACIRAALLWIDRVGAQAAAEVREKGQAVSER
ncbi:hypothetical protein DMC30DRAFT_37307 [Rhodotorula diobovata]|uniref:Uncharacterized protein n=1 Tax=Rhodotorula diobovata TaxID=5288 RepID=A0A5C5FPI2_9BASI|nr:hypothetical protein DMC30DRAFT_37307 [Rhodotorula diobovata]